MGLDGFSGVAISNKEEPGISALDKNGIMEKRMETTILYGSSIGIVEKKTETTTVRPMNCMEKVI